MQNEKYLRANEAASYLKVTVKTIYRMTSEKKIRYFKPNGKVILFSLIDLENFILSGEVQGPEP